MHYDTYNSLPNRQTTGICMSAFVNLIFTYMPSEYRVKIMLVFLFSAAALGKQKALI